MTSESIFNLIEQHQRQPAKKYEELTKVTTHDASAQHVEQKAMRNGRAGVRAPACTIQRAQSLDRGGGNSSHPAAVMPNMKAFEIAQKHKHADDEVVERKGRTKPSVPAVKRQELDAAEVARRRQKAQMGGGSMAAALGGESAMDRVRAAKKNLAAKNTEAIKEQSIINGLLKEQGLTAGLRPAARKPEFSGKPTQQLEPGQCNYVEKNKEAAIEQAQQRAEAAAAARAKAQGKTLSTNEAIKAKPAGQMPKYLIERKMEAEVDQMMKAEAERERNAGPKQMPEEERVATLAELERQRAAAQTELNLIPPTKHQLVQYQTQIKKLDARLAEIEKAIILFSRKVVYIQ